MMWVDVLWPLWAWQDLHLAESIACRKTLLTLPFKAWLYIKQYNDAPILSFKPLWTCFSYCWTLKYIFNIQKLYSGQMETTVQKSKVFICLRTLVYQNMQQSILLSQVTATSALCFETMLYFVVVVSCFVDPLELHCHPQSDSLMDAVFQLNGICTVVGTVGHCHPRPCLEQQIRTITLFFTFHCLHWVYMILYFPAINGLNSEKQAFI